MLKGKTVLLCVTGSIAAYKIAYLASALKKLRADVHVIMTENATNFINPITFETLTGNKCLVDTFDRNFEFSVEHVSLAKLADVVLVAPASANVIAKLAHGLADDMLTTTVLACTCKKIISPAMNTRMFENPITQDNLRICERYGMEVISPASGYLACGDTGAGKMPEPEVLLLDEPCSALDVKASAVIEETLLGLKERYTIVIVTHNIAQARRIADDAAFFSEGRLVEYGKAETLFTAPEKEETRSFLTGVCG